VTLAGGMTRTYHATATMSDGSTRDVTDLATWSSSNPAAAAIGYDPNLPALAMAVAPGQTTIRAQVGAAEAMVTVAVDGPLLRSISVSGAVPSGHRQSFRLAAIGTFFVPGAAMESERDLTRFVRWSSNAPSVAEVSNNSGFAGRVTTLSPGSAIITVTLGSLQSSETPVSAVAAHGHSMLVNPAVTKVAVGTQARLRATRVFFDSPATGVPAGWNSSDPTVVAVDGDGVLSAKAPGTATITANSAGLIAHAQVTVTPATLASLTVSPVNMMTPVDVPVPLTATGSFTDGTTQDLSDLVVWESAEPNLLAIEIIAGRRHAKFFGPGMASVTARYGGSTASAMMTGAAPALVRFTLVPSSATVPRWVTQRFVAEGLYADGVTRDLTDFVDWCPMDGCVQGPMVAGDKLGRTIIAARWGGRTSQAVLDVFEAEVEGTTITPATATLAVGGTMAFKAETTFVDARQRRTTIDVTGAGSWFRSPDDVVDVENAPYFQPGLVRGLSPGNAMVTFFFLDPGASRSLTITP
jgi:hypothetical protein